METTTSLEDARNLALQKIGRNLVNIQKLEGMLKDVLAKNHLEGHPSSIAIKATRRAQKVSKMTMGQVIHELATSLFDRSEVAQGQLELSREPWISSALTIEGGPDAARQWKLEMTTILEARNQLVHHMLVGFNPQSIESCESLSLALDSQQEKLIPIYEHIRSLIVARKEAYEEFCARSSPSSDPA